jgi:exodeoxyribonuclease VII small subunit
MKIEMKYDEAYAELQQIVRDMESGEIGVDALAEKVKRAALLIKICKSKLVKTEGDVKQILAELENNDEDENFEN